MISLSEDLFIIPILKGEGNIIYSPLRKGVFWADDEATNDVKAYLRGDSISDTSPVYPHIEQLKDIEVPPLVPHGINDGSHLVIILSQRCNLSCSYCYAQEARSQERLDINKLKIAILQVLSTSSNKSLSVSFIGGGEPLIEWDSIKETIEFIEANNVSKSISYSITTNLTILNNEILDYAKKYRIRFGVSFEILKDIQDIQRPFHLTNKSSFDIVHNNIKELMRRDIHFSIRSTITELNVTRMPEMARFVGENYPVLRKVHFEQVTDPAVNGPVFYNSFIHYFMLARTVGKEYNLNVYNSISNSVFNLKERFCRGEFCITPTGSIVTCHRLSSIRDYQYELFHVGDISNTGIIINDDDLKEYLSFSNKKFEQCKTCFARWHCAGICPMERCSLSGQQVKSKCFFSRKLIRLLLADVVANNK